MATTAGEVAHFSMVLYSSYEMETTLWYKSKKFWTLVAAIVAALAAFFTVSCSSTHYVTQSASSFRSGDTTTTVIRYEQVGSFNKR